MAKQVVLGQRSQGHDVRSSETHILVSTEVQQGIVQLLYEKPEAAQLVAAILNAGTASASEKPAFVEVTADPVEVTGASLSKEENGYRTLVLICGEVRVPIRLRSALVSEICSGSGDEIHRV